MPHCETTAQTAGPAPRRGLRNYCGKCLRRRDYTTLWSWAAGRAGSSSPPGSATSSASASKAQITLIDKARTHLWKPLLHEIAAGSMDLGVHELDYLAQSHWHHFRYRVGEMVGLDRARREVHVAPFHDEEGTARHPGADVPLRHARYCRRQQWQRFRHARG